MTRETLERETQSILDGVVTLANMVEQAILDSVRSLQEKDFDLSKKIYDADEEINQQRNHLEQETIELIARQQPVASDLRILAAVFEVITELERMGDYAKGIAKVNLLIGEEPFIIPLDNITKMAELTAGMLHRSIKAFYDKDAESAYKIPKEDDQVDKIYYSTYTELIHTIAKDPRRTDHANRLMWVTHNLERTADRVTNLCERAIYIATGKLEDLDASDDEDRLFEKGAD